VVFAAAAVSCQVTWRLWPAGFAVVTFGVAEVLVVVVKAIVGRPGPGVWADRDGYPGYFPSGHAATAMVATGIVVFLAMVVPRGSRRRGQASLASLVAGLVVGSAAGAYAIVGDYHWTSDVVGSIALTAPVLVVAGAVVRTRIYAAESVGHAR
jgi:undecaprenyl-diphosphatase